MKKVAIYGQHFDVGNADCLQELIAVLEEQNIQIYFEEGYFKQVSKHLALGDRFLRFKETTADFASLDLFVSLGGDGTILRAITYVRDLGIPILGINTGRLGFLATVNRTEIKAAFEKLFSGEFQVEERSLIAASVADKYVDFPELNFALNEITVSRKNTTSMITVETYLNGEYLTSYWADGLIISTPTGSTGYSLSCGGPVIMPTANSFVLTPIAPHNLNARPLVISDDTIIKLSVSGRENSHLVSLDSRIASLRNETEIILKKADFKIKMITLPNEGFFKTLRNKLLWGADKRN